MTRATCELLLYRVTFFLQVLTNAQKTPNMGSICTTIESGIAKITEALEALDDALETEEDEESIQGFVASLSEARTAREFLAMVSAAKSSARSLAAAAKPAKA